MPKYTYTFRKRFSFISKNVFPVSILNPFSPEIIWKNANKKQTKNHTFNGYISKTRANSESKLELSESSFKFLQKSFVFWHALPTWLRPIKPPVPLPAARSIQRVKQNKEIKLTMALKMFLLYILRRKIICGISEIPRI